MPVLPDPRQNFIHALSDFWSAFFKDTAQIESFYKGVEINIGQVYLELLETVLGTGLRNIPVFSKRYYKPFTIGEDELFFVEGQAVELNRYKYTPIDEIVHDVGALMNRVIDPTSVMEVVTNFEVSDSAILFHENLFDVDGAGSSIPSYPVRTVVKTFAATYKDPLGRSWKTAGAKIGDTLRFRIRGGSAFDSVIIGIDGDTLRLINSFPEYSLDLTGRTYSVSVLRKPFDVQQVGLPLPAQPLLVEPLGPGSINAVLLPGTATFDISTQPYFKGAWLVTTAYAVGDTVIDPFTFIPTMAKVAHTSGVVFDSTLWEPYLGKYFYVHHPDDVTNDGLFSGAAWGTTTVTLFRPNFTTAASMDAQITMVGYPLTVSGGPKPQVPLAHAFINPGTLSISSRRKHDVSRREANGSITVYPANEVVVEGVDYTIDYEVGTLYFLSGWDPIVPGFLQYTWWYDVVMYTLTAQGPWVPATYAVGDTVTYGGVAYVCKTANSDLAFTPINWLVYTGPFFFGQSLPVRQLALWGADVLIDREALYNNFGYLLAFKRPSSEQYRAFLRGVAQLFVIGPTLERFESALNVMSDLPVIRDDGEVLRAYNNGILFSGADGQLTDVNMGRDGTLTAATSQFSSPTADFFPSDIGAIIRIRIGPAYVNFIIANVLTATTVVLSTVPPDATNAVWSYTHLDLSRRFRTGSYAFTTADLDALIVIEGASNSSNNGSFRVLSVENASTVVLESTYGFIDESSLAWRISRTKIQQVTTSRATYDIPLLVPIRADIVLPASINTLTFQAFETMTDAFVVEDYVQNPTWWCHTAIPPEVLQLIQESSARRRVSPNFIEHRLNPLDGALLGDFGLAVGVDDEGRPGIERSGPAAWYGGPDIVLSLPVGMPVANARDVTCYVTIRTPGFAGQFQIMAVDTAGTTLRLDRFPPPEARGLAPVIGLDVSLAPLIFRRTVAFVMMDRYLKHHALHIKIHPLATLPTSFYAETTQLLKEAKPSFTYVYLDAATDLTDTIQIVEDLTLQVGIPMLEPIFTANSSMLIGPPSLLQLNDTYVYQDGTQIIPAAPGVYALTPALPGVGSPRFHVVKAWFDLSVIIVGTPSRRLTEGVDYTVDRINGLITVINALPGPTTLNYTVVILRTRLETDTFYSATLDPGETPIAIGGSDPTISLGVGQSVSDAGLIDHAVQLTIGP